MSDIPSGALDAGESKAVSLLARIILPRPGEPLDVRKLYIEESETNTRRAHPPSRTTLEIGAESEVSFATYFNAFPASYWRRWSTLESVVLRVELTGSARVDVYRSKATGARITVGGAPISSGASNEHAVVEFEIDLDPFEDGGWIWFDITTESKATMHSAGWYAPVPAPGRANVAVGIPTFNRPADCVNALAALTSDPLVDEVIGAVIVSDQGAKKAVDHPDYAAAAAPLGNRLTIHNQPNLGGSGGYSRVMYEALKNTDCEQILFMDDDIRVEPDSILRLLGATEALTAPATCAGCHAQKVNPPGFVLERYDAVGGWQDTDPLGGPINSTADVTFDGAKFQTISAPADLMTGIAASPNAQQFYAAMWVNFAAGRPSTLNDACVVEQLTTNLAQPTYTIASMMADFAKSDSFRLRTLGN